MIEISRCPACNAPVPPGSARCDFCGVYFAKERHAPPLPPLPPMDAPAGVPEGALAFERVREPNEGAFSLLVPVGWQVRGGIQRAHQGVLSAQSIEAKLDFCVQRDDEASVAIRWCPDVKFKAPGFSPAEMMGFFGAGGQYQGMQVVPLLSPVDFLVRIAFPWAHPEAEQVQVAAQKPLPLLVDIYRQKMAAFGQPSPGAYQGGTVTFAYAERGRRYAEKAYAVIENLGPMAAGMWSNKDTLLIRAPLGELARWEPILHHIRESVQLEHRWLAQEVVNQEFMGRSFLHAQQAAQAREQRMLQLQRQMQDVDRQITEHRARTNAEIHNDAYLTMMEQEEYINPFTNQPETGSNQWHYRWTNADGAEFYSDSEDHDPNLWGLMNCSDWRRTPVRPRFGG